MDPIVVYDPEFSAERDKPRIDMLLPENAWKHYDWVTIGEVLKGRWALDKYVVPTVYIKHPDVPLWDYYWGPAGPLVSPSLKQYFESIPSPCFSFLPAYINEYEYYFFRKERSIDCLDRERSDILWSPSDLKKVLYVEKYAFKFEHLRDPMLFAIPESGKEPFLTQGVKKGIEDAGFRGIVFTELARSDQSQ